MKEARVYKGVEYPHNFRIYAKFNKRDVEPEHGQIIGETRSIHERYKTALLIWVLDSKGVGSIITMSRERYSEFIETFGKEKMDPLLRLLRDSNYGTDTEYYKFSEQFSSIRVAIFNIIAGKFANELDNDEIYFGDDFFIPLLINANENVTPDQYFAFLDKFPELSNVILGLILSEIKAKG